MLVFSDLHHGELYESIRILFEGRMGAKLYRQVGESWYDNGYWRVYDHPNTVAQYLGLYATVEYQKLQAENPGVRDWKNRDSTREGEGQYTILDHEWGAVHNAVTLEAFKGMKFDIIVSSMPQHIEPFERLRREFQPHAKHIFQQGNNWPADPRVVNMLNSTTVQPPAGANHVRYHQEFDLTRWAPVKPPETSSMCSMMHCLRGKGLTDWNSLCGHLPGWTLKNYGAGNPDGPVAYSDIATAMGAFLYHNKEGGDGYGYNIHHASAMGRPIVCRLSYFKGMTAEPLLIPGKTCINLDDGNMSRAASQMNDWARHGFEQRSAEIVKNFRSVVDFDKEFTHIKNFMNTLR